MQLPVPVSRFCWQWIGEMRVIVVGGKGEGGDKRDVQELDFYGGKTEHWERLKDPKCYDSNLSFVHDQNIYVFRGTAFMQARSRCSPRTSAWTS